MHTATSSLLAEWGRKISATSDDLCDDREHGNPFQQIAVLIKHYNAVLLQRDFSESRPDIDCRVLTTFFHNFFIPLGNPTAIKKNKMITITTRNSCTGRSPVQSIGRARNCGRRNLDRADLAVTKMQISLVIVNGFENGFQQWIQRIFLVVVEAEKIGFRKKIFKSWMHFAALLRLNRWC